MKFIDRTYSFYKDLPAWGKAVVVIGGGAIAWFGIVNPIRKLIVKKLDEAKDQKTVNEYKDDIRALNKKGIRASFSEAQYRSWGEQIANTFAGCDWDNVFDTPLNIRTFSGSGKRFYTIINQLKNDADFAELQAAFDVKTYDQCGFWPFAGDFTGGLHKAVNDELVTSEIKEINKLLTSKKINYQF